MKCLKSVAKITLIVIVMILLVWVISLSKNAYKENLVKQTATTYIVSTYPDFKIHHIDVEYDWKPNMYVVTYSDESGNVRKVAFDHTGKKLAIDNYIEETSSQVIYDYTNGIKNKLQAEIESKVVPIHYLVIDLYKKPEEKREIVIDGKGINNDPVDCSVGFNYNGILSKTQFVELVVQSVQIIKELNIQTKTLKFVSQNSPENRFDLEWEESMSTMSLEQLVQFVN